MRPSPARHHLALEFRLTDGKYCLDHNQLDEIQTLSRVDHIHWNHQDLRPPKNEAGVPATGAALLLQSLGYSKTERGKEHVFAVAC